MSSPKNYNLIIEPEIDDEDNLSQHNILKFTVKHKSDFIYSNKYIISGIFTLIFGIYSHNKYRTLFELSFRENLINWLILAIYLLFTVIILCKVQAEDTVLILKDIGVQLNSKKNWLFQNQIKQFIPLNNIIDLVVHEGMHGYAQVIFYLCVLTKSNDLHKPENSIEVIFPFFLPRKEVLLKVRKLSRNILFADSKKYFRRVPGQGLKQIHHH